MTRALAIALGLAAGCGRLAFDPVSDAGSGADADAPTDAGIPRLSSFHASNADPDDQFGQSVAIAADGATFVVGAEFEDSLVPASGAAYVFVRSGTTWVEEAILKASNPGMGDRFGSGLAISGDGSTIALGAVAEASAATGIGGNQADNTAVAAGAVYVFVRAGSAWIQQAYVKASNTGASDSFGLVLALSDDGNTLAVAAPGEDSGAIGIGGNQGDNSIVESGAAYVFTRTGSVWSQQAYIKSSNTSANDRFGDTLSLSGDGSTLACTALYEGSIATGINGDQLNNTALGAGAVYVFTRAGTVWSQQAYVKASNTAAGDFFGSSVSLSDDGNTLLATAINEASAAGAGQGDNSTPMSGAGYVFARVGTTWSQQAFLKATNADANDALGFNAKVSGNGQTIAIGAEFEDGGASGTGGNQADNSLSDAGAVYVFARTGSAWTQRTYLKAPNPGLGDSFGDSVALSAAGGTLVVGARFEDGANESVNNSGVIYVYE